MRAYGKRLFYGEEAGKVGYRGEETPRNARERGFRLGIVTNRAFGGRRFGADMAAAASTSMGTTFSSSRLSCGYLKPHTRHFDVGAR